MADDALNEDESNALLRDLENRAGKRPAAAADADDDEDIEAFLRSLESEDAPARPTKVADKPAPKPVPIKEAPKAEMVPKPEPAKAPKEAKASKEEAKASKEVKEPKTTKEPKEETGASSKKAVVFKFLAKSLVVLTPTLALWWLLGAYLSQWISAWWLVLTLASLVTVAIPVGLKLVAKRGAMGWWFAGVSVVIALLLTLPLPTTAASAIGAYGHWPATSLEASGAVSTGSVFSSVNQWVSLKVAQLLAPGEYAANALGTQTPLNPEVKTPPLTPEPTPDVKTPDVKTPEVTPDVKTPEVKTPEVTTPEVTTPEVVPPTGEPTTP